MLAFFYQHHGSVMGGGTIQGAIGFVEEAIHGCEHHRHGQLLGVDEIQGLGHGDEDLRVDPGDGLCGNCCDFIGKIWENAGSSRKNGALTMLSLRTILNSDAV